MQKIYPILAHHWQLIPLSRVVGTLEAAPHGSASVNSL